MEELEKQKKVYDKIVNLYGYAEDIIRAVEREGVTNPEEQLSWVTPLVEQIMDQLDVISETAAEYLESCEKGSPIASRKIDSAVRKIVVEMDKFRDIVVEKAAQK